MTQTDINMALAQFCVGILYIATILWFPVWITALFFGISMVVHSKKKVDLDYGAQVIGTAFFMLVAGAMVLGLLWYYQLPVSNAVTPTGVSF